MSPNDIPLYPVLTLLIHFVFLYNCIFLFIYFVSVHQHTQPGGLIVTHIFRYFSCHMFCG